LVERRIGGSNPFEIIAEAPLILSTLNSTLFTDPAIRSVSEIELHTDGRRTTPTDVGMQPSPNS
jgi:hypothetical protein